MKFINTICIAALGSALFRMLVPENKFSKQISILISSVFLLTALTAIGGADLDIDFEKYDTAAAEYSTEISKNANKELQNKICKEMSDKIYGILNAREIYPEEIRVIVNISGLYSINITQVELVFKNGEEAAATAAAELLKSELSPDIKIKTEVE